MWHFRFTVAILEVYLHSKFRAGSGQSPVFLSVFAFMGCSQSAKAAPSAVGMKRTQIKNCDSIFLFYWFMACGQLAEARISRGPLCISLSLIRKFHTRQVPYLEAVCWPDRNRMQWVCQNNSALPTNSGIIGVCVGTDREEMNLVPTT